MTEFHPLLRSGNLQLNESKVILGSFPAWSVSIGKSKISQNDENTCLSTSKPKDSLFFFGSSNNLFWNWYKFYVDSNIDLLSVPSILKSLEDKQIGITDMILSCKRKGKSSLDKHLTERIYNHEFIVAPPQGKILKILCTSKGVMNEMLLSKNFFLKLRGVSVNEQKSDNFHANFLLEINGKLDLLKKPIYTSLEVEGFGGIECLALPSPGSPYRKLENFGFASLDRQTFLENYLAASFRWFLL
jgi:hypothetical protein